MEQLKCINIQNMIKYYRSNDVSKLSPEDIEFINLIRDMFLHSDPLPVNVAKKFESDEQMIEYYKNLEQKYASSDNGDVSGSIFNKTFIISPIMKAYADKFYKRRLNLASTHLSDVVKYQIANAVTQNKPLPIVQNDVTDEYLKLIHHKANVSPNVAKVKENKTNSRMNMCSEIFDNLVSDVLFGSHNGYYINNCLSPELRHKVYRFRDNITFLVRAPLTLSTNIYNLIEEAAVHHGQSPDKSIVPPSPVYPQTSAQQSLSELAFENEALRRGLIQQLNVVYDNLS
ncbi:gp41 [Spodoptera litura granulovirus]|uniref:Gp41 n=1 Tax=Spodoptera litura granulovirus TaxID=359919 RepID=A5IZU7_9BBAC|nr:gp41 [Spodoptera litura granulovirus]ABQ52038.1 gp41 [Spodoptera litura granulovirus]